MNLTQIQVTKDIRRKLKGCKQHKKESYNEVVNRLIKHYKATKR